MRLDDWPQRLAAVIDAARRRPFGYGPGECHCCLLAGDAVMAMTGVDPMAWFRGRYKTRRGAYAALRRFAGGGLAEAMDRVAAERSYKRIPTRMAQRGDVVMHDTPDGPGLGVCVGSTFVAIADGGVIFPPMAAASAAWRIG